MIFEKSSSTWRVAQLLSNIGQKVAVWRRSNQAARPSSEQPAMGEQSGKLVLLVEDEPVVQRLIAKYLVAEGYKVQTAIDGLDAIAKLRAGLPELIISDLRMPRMDGFELFHVVHKRFPQIPIMLMGDEAPSAWPERVASDAYFQKNGFGFHQLPEVIAELNKGLQLRPAPPPVDSKPAQAMRDGNDRYVVNCRDCLREFSIPRIFHVRGAQNWTSCFHCGKMIQFCVAEQSENK
jgi:CheY-like chemotaxis protein